jgi:hypothetical protein
MRITTGCRIGAVAAYAWVAAAMFGSPNERHLDRATVRHLAEIYRLAPNEAESRCDALRGSHRGEALKSIEYLERAKAFELAALALGDVADQVVKNNLIRFVATKPEFSRSVFAVALHELELANADSSNFDDGEYRAGVENTKKILANAISGWLHLPKPRSASGSNPSANEYTAFITGAKEKSRGITVDSPY